MEQAYDLTEGNIKRQLIYLSIPLLIGSIFQQFYNTIDSIIVGTYVGHDAFAAIGISGTIMNLFIFIVIGCCTGISIITAQLYGEKNYEYMRNEIFLSSVLGGVATIIISVLGIIFMPIILNIIQTPSQLKGYVTQYMNVILGGLISTFLYNFLSSILRSVGNTKMALIFLVISIILNIILDLVLIKQFSMGIIGAALATVISQLVSAVLLYLYIIFKIPFLRVKKGDIKYNFKLIKLTCQYSFVSALHQSSLYIGKLLVQGAVNSLGIDAISAYTATGRIEDVILAFGNSGAEATSIFIAQNTGAKNYKRVLEGFKNALILIQLVCILIILFLFFKSDILLNFFVFDEGKSVLNYGVQYFRIISLFYIISLVGSIFVGYYRGTGHVNIPVIGTTLQITIRVILSYLLSRTMGIGGVALATGIGWVGIITFQISVFVIKKYYKIQTEDVGVDISAK
ncbi:MATE family efflux transporter [Intestinibacter sp.]|uniref:MATE family efflux transporter n=1 Tax=Intestinibacter sp. TaxID=1965304 RepID=UPI002A90A313|nr:MATE family efflux transporter [Intestinibacter sp.]MDY5213582.1 MATE family efflux transporter [Intestinibacter sp.]